MHHEPTRKFLLSKWATGTLLVLVSGLFSVTGHAKSYCPASSDIQSQLISDDPDVGHPYTLYYARSGDIVWFTMVDMSTGDKGQVKNLNSNILSDFKSTVGLNPDMPISTVICQYETTGQEPNNHLTLSTWPADEQHLYTPSLKGNQKVWTKIDATENAPAGFFCQFSPVNGQDDPTQCPFNKDMFIAESDTATPEITIAPAAPATPAAPAASANPATP